MNLVNCMLRINLYSKHSPQRYPSCAEIIQNSTLCGICILHFKLKNHVRFKLILLVAVQVRNNLAFVLHQYALS